MVAMVNEVNEEQITQPTPHIEQTSSTDLPTPDLTGAKAPFFTQFTGRTRIVVATLGAAVVTIALILFWFYSAEKSPVQDSSSASQVANQASSSSTVQRVPITSPLENQNQDEGGLKEVLEQEKSTTKTPESTLENTQSVAAVVEEPLAPSSNISIHTSASNPAVSLVQKTDIRTAPASSITESGQSYYYDYSSGAVSTQSFKSGSSYPVGTRMSGLLSVSNTGAAASPQSTVLISVRTESTGKTTTESMNIEDLLVGASKSYSMSSYLPTAVGSYTITYTVDPENKVKESNESDNKHSFSYTITPDTTKPYLELYGASLQTSSANGPQVCYNRGQVFCRDDQDAGVSGPSQTTQLRYKFLDQWSDWIPYTSLPSETQVCVSAEEARAYALTVQCRDKTGTTAELSITRTYTSSSE